MRSLLLLFILPVLPLSRCVAADSNPVVSISGADRVVVKYQGLPVCVPLANIEVPATREAQDACQAELVHLLKGRKVELLFKPGFGVDQFGNGKVQLLSGTTNINETIVAEGFAKYSPGFSREPEDEVIRKAEERAKIRQQGIWSSTVVSDNASTPDKPAVEIPKPETNSVQSIPPDPAVIASGGSGLSKPAFCSEINTKYYYATGSRLVANVNPQRLIYYLDESAARRAGKLPSPQVLQESILSDGTEASADSIFAQGKEVYAEAIAKGNTPERDQMYEKAFVILSKAMQVYSALCEEHPDDDKLGEKLRQCMQLRYGSVKQRRFE